MTLFNGLLELTWALAWLGALLTVPSVLLQRRGRPVAALSWLLALFAIPLVTLFAWWLLGRTHLKRRRQRRRRASRSIGRSLVRTRRELMDGQAGGDEGRQLHKPIGNSVFPATGGNEVQLLAGFEDVLQAWEQLILGARHHLHLLFYTWRNDRVGRRIRDLLVDRARKGVSVRVLYDSIGSLGLGASFFRPLREAGGQAEPFLPIRLLSLAPTVNFRNHRKLIVADGRRAYSGGINVSDEQVDWRDLGVLLQGPGVNQLQEAFVDDWFFTTGEELAGRGYFCDHASNDPGQGALCESVASGPDQQFNAMRERVFLGIGECRRRLYIATPYFVPDSALMIALRSAVYRGVDVRLYLPAISDAPLVRHASRAFYADLLAGGVRVFEYPGMLHAKAMLMDGERVLIGSANLDNRSFRLNFELGSFITDASLNASLHDFFRRIASRCREVGQEELRDKSTAARLRDALAHLLSPLL